MVYYYLDLETYSSGKHPDPGKDRVIVIVLCAMDPKTGRPVQEPLVLKEWESSEKELVSSLAERMFKGRTFDFIPVGFNTLFDLWVIKHKLLQFLKKDLGDRFYLEYPYLDLKHVAVLANKGRFKGVRLGVVGNPVRDWYEYEDYASIEQYAREKMSAFFAQYAAWVKRL